MAKLTLAPGACCVPTRKPMQRLSGHSREPHAVHQRQDLGNSLREFAEALGRFYPITGETLLTGNNKESA